MRLLGWVGSFSKVSLSQSGGSRPLSLAVPSRVWMTAARLPARSEPANNQFFFPTAMGRMAFSAGLLSDRQVAGFGVADQRRPALEGVVEGFGGAATVGGLGTGLDQPLMQGFQRGQGKVLAPAFAVFDGNVLGLPLDLVKPAMRCSASWAMGLWLVWRWKNLRRAWAMQPPSVRMPPIRSEQVLVAATKLFRT